MTRRSAAGKWRPGKPRRTWAPSLVSPPELPARQLRKDPPKPDEPQMKQTLG